MNFSIIYKTTNLINGKIYVGKHTQDLCPTIFDGYLGSGVIIKSAIRKYGKKNFERITLESFSTEEESYEKEEYWISKLKSRDPKIGYNIFPGGWGFTSETAKEINSRPEIIELHRKNTTEMWQDIEFKNRISLAVKLSRNTPEQKEGQSKRSLLMWESQEFRDKHSKKMTENWLTSGYRENHSEKMKSKWEESDYRNLMILKMTEVQNRPEVKEKVSLYVRGSKNGRAKFHYVLKDPQGNIWETDCLTEFCREHNLTHGHMSSVANGNRNHHKGWICISKTLRIDKEIKNANLS